MITSSWPIATEIRCGPARGICTPEAQKTPRKTIAPPLLTASSSPTTTTKTQSDSTALGLEGNKQDSTEQQRERKIGTLGPGKQVQQTSGPPAQPSWGSDETDTVQLAKKRRRQTTSRLQHIRGNLHRP